MSSQNPNVTQALYPNNGPPPQPPSQNGSPNPNAQQCFGKGGKKKGNNYHYYIVKGVAAAKNKPQLCCLHPVLGLPYRT
ncbi:unnamed protein product [Prunus armeniaca]|uniref:Uncharacterized protein n=1 Tax=Prunus armeniaca TaxID=36596 RepID=A0A6J5V4T4_PRUAR|nr:unnamed protein product [Prunus armeniaca]